MRLGDEQSRELLVTSLSRARFAEELGPPSGLPSHRLDLFLTGMRSVVDALVGRPMREVLSGLAGPRAVHTALTGGDHPVGSVLRMIKAYERDDCGAVDSAPTPWRTAPVMG
jgi:EAL and modified HD-GYP domain-containing signal transduction protein